MVRGHGIPERAETQAFLLVPPSSVKGQHIRRPVESVLPFQLLIAFTLALKDSLSQGVGE